VNKKNNEEDHNSGMFIIQWRGESVS